MNQDAEQIERVVNIAERKLRHKSSQTGKELTLTSQSEHVAAEGLPEQDGCRYKCFTIGATADGDNFTLANNPTTSYLVTTPSKDGKCQVLGFVDDSGEEDIRICIQMWILKDAIRGFQLQTESIIMVQKIDSGYTSYGAPHEQRLPLMLTASRGLAPEFVRLGSKGGVIHVGCRSYLLNESKDKKSSSLLNLKLSDTSHPLFEESCQEGSILVLANRRQPKSIENDFPMDRAQHSARMKRICDDNRRDFGRAFSLFESDTIFECGNCFDGGNVFECGNDTFGLSIHDKDTFGVFDGDRGGQIGSDISSLPDPTDAEMQSESDNSLLDNQSLSETESAVSDIMSLSNKGNSVEHQHADQGGGDFDFDESQTEDSEDDMSSLMSASSRRLSDVEVASSQSLISETNQDGDEAHSSDPVTIKPGKLLVFCIVCENGFLQAWYHCPICEPGGDFDLCTDCFQKGFWCYDQDHPLHECDYNGSRGTIPWSAYLFQQDFRVFDLAEDSEKEIFKWTGSQQDLLHESPPVLAPSMNLAVWPVGQESLLFTNYERARSRVHAVQATSSKAHQLSIALHFSDCGRYLYVAHMEAERLFDRKASSASSDPHTYALTFVLTTLRISSKSPFIQRPQTVSRISYSLETTQKHYSRFLPYQWTWTSTDVYLCLSASTLLVYKIPLAQPGSDVADTNAVTVTTLSETIFLPRSAQDRSVQFFPPPSPGAPSKVIIGPHFEGTKTLLPVCIYLQDKDLWRWINAKDQDHTKAFRHLERDARDDSEPFESDEYINPILVDKDG